VPEERKERVASKNRRHRIETNLSIEVCSTSHISGLKENTVFDFIRGVKERGGGEKE